jgi:glycosyltransferase involved in cell wall biosynthesis
MKSIKICCVIPSLHPGGMERVMSVLINEFSKKKDVEIHLILYGLKRDIFYYLPKNITVYKPNFTFKNKFRIISTLRTLWFLRKQISCINPSTVLSFGEYWNSMVLIALLGKSFPVFVSDRCQPDKSLGKMHDFLRKILYPTAIGVIAQTAYARNFYAKQFDSKKITVIGNPINSIVKNKGVSKENIVLSIGRLIKSKHHDELIIIFAKINNPIWKLVIVGDDALKQQNKLNLQYLINDLGMNDRIILAGKQEDVENYYQKSKIFAFMSSSEGFPNVIGEAQSAALPVIAFDCIAGPADLINNNHNGYLIPLFDYKQYQEKLRELMINKDLRESMGNNAQKSIKNFEADKISELYFKYILQ